MGKRVADAGLNRPGGRTGRGPALATGPRHASEGSAPPRSGTGRAGVPAAVLLLPALVLPGCAEDSSPAGGPVVTDSAGVSLVEVPAEIDLPVRELALDGSWEPSPGLELGELTDLDVFPDGRIVLLDALNASVHLLTHDGAPIRSFGSAGEGPGELAPSGLRHVLVAGGEVLVPDLQLQGIVRFDTDGAFLGNVPMAGRGSPDGLVYAVDWRPHPAGGLAYRELKPDAELLLHVRDGRLDTLRVERFDVRHPNLLLPPSLIWDLGEDGRLLIGRTDQSETRAVPAEEGDGGWILRRASGPGGEPSDGELSDAEVAHLRGLLLESAERRGTGGMSADQRERILASVQLPTAAPRFSALLAGPEGSAWVQRARPVEALGVEALRIGDSRGTGGREWEVIDADGLPVRVMRLPERFTPLRFVGRCMYGSLASSSGVERPARVCTDS